MAKTDLLVIDDWGLAPLTSPERHDLLEVLEDRTERAATLITSQVPVKAWHELIGPSLRGTRAKAQQAGASGGDETEPAAARPSGPRKRA